MSNIKHSMPIEKGVFGEFSKIKEEYLEAVDANNRNCKVLLLCELCDLVGAIDGFLKTKYNMTLFDAYNFSKEISQEKMINNNNNNNNN